MGFRGVVKDLLVLLLAYYVIRAWIYKEQISTGVIYLAVIICMVVIWFMLERIGVIPKVI